MSVFDHTLVVGEGDNCCGIYHLVDFPNQVGGGPWATKTPPIFKRMEILHEGMLDIALHEIGLSRSQLISGSSWPCVVMVTLIERQDRQWRTPLARLGFKRFERFLNRNSGNTVSIYLLKADKPWKNYVGNLLQSKD